MYINMHFNGRETSVRFEQHHSYDHIHLSQNPGGEISFFVPPGEGPALSAAFQEVARIANERRGVT